MSDSDTTWGPLFHNFWTLWEEQLSWGWSSHVTEAQSNQDQDNLLGNSLSSLKRLSSGFWISCIKRKSKKGSQNSSSIAGETKWEAQFGVRSKWSFYTVHRVLTARILEWFAIPSFSGPVLSELSTMTHPSWVALHGMPHSFIELRKPFITTSQWSMSTKELSCWRRLKSSLDSKGIKSVLKEINPTYLLEGLMLKLKLQYFDQLM